MTTATTRRRTSAGLLAIVVAVSMSLVACGSGNDPAAPQLDDPAATAKTLVTNWLEALKAGDLDAVGDAMAPSFQIQRGDGSSADRAAYLANPAKVSSYVLGDQIVATQSGDTLTVRWSIKVTETINGVTYTDVEAPRLVAFEWQDGAWRIISYANFNPAPAAG
jgi:ketosteroid isomerase-like protein